MDGEVVVVRWYMMNGDGKMMDWEMEMVGGLVGENLGEGGKEEGEEMVVKVLEEEKEMGMEE